MFLGALLVEDRAEFPGWGLARVLSCFAGATPSAHPFPTGLSSAWA